ncbi:hypothetical protein GGS21DRAFT_288873 [Xylaria nigripes]|nr:hypothetical protein GGS21DRAFT_288873 [Xylaria nigripes]
MRSIPAKRGLVSSAYHSQAHSFVRSTSVMRMTAAGQFLESTTQVRVRKDTYCESHQSRQKDQCMNTILTMTGNAARKFFFLHVCDINTTGEGERVEGADGKACETLACRLYWAQSRCRKPRNNIRGMHCRDHECIDEICTAEKYQATDWCARYLCMAAFTGQKTCNKQREGTATNRDYCPDHKVCTESDYSTYGAFLGNLKQEKWEERETRHVLVRNSFSYSMRCLVFVTIRRRGRLSILRQ